MSDPDRHIPAREPLAGRCGHRGAGCSCCSGMRGTRDQKARERHQVARAVRAMLADRAEADDVRNAVVRSWAALGWDSPEDAVYDRYDPQTNDTEEKP